LIVIPYTPTLVTREVAANNIVLTVGLKRVISEADPPLGATTTICELMVPQRPPELSVTRKLADEVPLPVMMFLFDTAMLIDELKLRVMAVAEEQMYP
jgi:hypothetical protein